MGRKEDNIAKAKDLMSKLDYIRNIGIAAHIDHGKCISADALVSLTNGENISAKNLFERDEKSGEVKSGQTKAPTGFVCQQPR